MKIIAFVCTLFLCLTTVTPDSYVGEWRIESGSIIEIYRNNDVFFGKILKRADKIITNENGLDNKNPDPKLRTRPIIGSIILKNLLFKEGQLAEGTIYNSDVGKTFDVKLWINEENLDVCNIQVSLGILHRTFKAHRIKN